MAFTLPGDCVQQYLYPLWQQTYKGNNVYVLYPNSKKLLFNDGATDTAIDTATNAWGRLTVRSAVNTPTLGAESESVDQGIIFFDLFFPEGDGIIQAKSVVSQAFSLMKNKRMVANDGTQIRTLSPTVNAIGFDGEFYHYHDKDTPVY